LSRYASLGGGEHGRTACLREAAAFGAVRAGFVLDAGVELGVDFGEGGG